MRAEFKLKNAIGSNFCGKTGQIEGRTGQLDKFRGKTGQMESKTGQLDKTGQDLPKLDNPVENWTSGNPAPYQKEMV